MKILKRFTGIFLFKRRLSSYKYNLDYVTEVDTIALFSSILLKHTILVLYVINSFTL